MKTKSIFLGIILATLALLAMGSGATSPSGRYAVSGGSSVVVILDTVSGKAWAANLSTINGTQAGFWDAKEGQ